MFRLEAHHDLARLVVLPNKEVVAQLAASQHLEVVGVCVQGGSHLIGFLDVLRGRFLCFARSGDRGRLFSEAHYLPYNAFFLRVLSCPNGWQLLLFLYMSSLVVTLCQFVQVFALPPLVHMGNTGHSPYNAQLAAPLFFV